MPVPVMSSSTQRQRLARVREGFGHRLVDDAPDRGPAVQLGALLAADRQHSVPFDDAWDRHVEQVLATVQGRSLEEWQQAFTWARPAFRAAYERADGPGSTMRLDESVLA